MKSILHKFDTTLQRTIAQQLSLGSSKESLQMYFVGDDPILFE